MPLPTMRASQVPESRPKEVDFLAFTLQHEMEYPNWMNWGRLVTFVRLRLESTMWNVVLCVSTLVAIVILSMDFVSLEAVFGVPVSRVIDIAYNVIYGIDMIAEMWNDCYIYHHEQQHHQFTKKHWLRYVLDGATYLHYVTLVVPNRKFMNMDIKYIVTMTCYNLRLRRIYTYLVNFNNNYLKGGVFTSLLKYWYIFVLIRVIYSNILIWLGLTPVIKYKLLPTTLNNSRAIMFFHAFYILDKRFFPIGSDWPPNSDLDRVVTMIVAISGTLLITGISVAALALIFSTSMRPVYLYRDRFRLIINDMRWTRVPSELSEKVEAFYKIFWHKQKAVTVTQLLPTYPPPLVNTLTTDIYFEALQKSQILRDLSYQFLSELAKHMTTINYIPGDVIIKRNSIKYALVYITYGDVEMVTAEDDQTPIFRFTRGSILNPCGVCMDVACCKDHVSVRAATVCTAHVLRAADLWRVAIKYGHLTGQTYIIHSAMEDHLDRVVRHFAQRPPTLAKHKSSVLQLKRNLIELKEARDENGKLLIGRTDFFLEIADCYIMRNQADPLALTEESDAICLRSTFPCILQPTSDLQILWRIFVTVVTVAVTFVHPYYLVFKKGLDLPYNFVFFNFLVTVIYILDIIVYLSTGTKIEEGVAISLLQTSSRQMRSVWFVPDVLAAVPIFDFIGDGELSGLNKLCKLLYVFRTLKILEEMLVFHSNTLQFITFCLLVIVFIWLVAALNHGFLCFKLNFCRIFSFLDSDVWEFNKTAKTDSEVEDILAYSVFWATSLTTITSHITSEGSKHHYPTQVQVMCILEVGVFLHIVVLAAYAANIVVTGQLRNQYDACIDTVQLFLQKNDANPELQQRFISYLHLCWYSDKAYRLTHEKSSILFDLPQNVHQDISAMQRNKYLLCIPFMKELPENMLKSICATAHLFYISPNEILLNTGDISNEIYVIKRGFCEVLDPDTKKVVSVITANAYFGDIECLMRLPAYYTVRAVTHVEVFSVSLKYLMEAIATKKIRDAILYIKDQPEYQKLLENRREQFLKYEQPPPPGNRMSFRLPRKHENDAEFLKPFQYLGFFSMLRYVFPRFTIRPDGQYLQRHERVRAFFAMCSALITPSFYLFDLQYASVYYITWMFDFTAYFDVLQRMLVGYFNDKGILVYHPASTFIHYARGALIVDLLACLPLESMEDMDVYLHMTADYTEIPKAMELLLFNRILQLYRLPSALSFLEDYIQRRDIVYCIKFTPMFLVLITTVGTLIRINSVRKFKYHKGGWTINPKSGRFTSWILYNSTNVGYNITKTPFNIWLTTTYWATSQLTSTGFGIFLPDSKLLLLIFIVGMFIASITSMYVSVRMLSARSNVNQALADYTDNMKDMIEFMKREKFPRDLRREVLSYYKYTWEKTGGTDYRSVFKLCDQITLRTDAILHIYGETFQKCPILHKCDIWLLRQLARAMHSVYFHRGTTVIERDDVNSDLYFVDYGIVQARSSVDNEIVDAMLPRGSLFGNLNNVVREVSASSFVVQSNVHLLKIESWIFYSILKDFPTTKARLAKYRPNEENYVVSQDAEKYMKNLSLSSAMKIHKNERLISYFYSHSKFMIVYVSTVCLLCIFLDVYNAGFQDNRRFLIYVLYSLDLAFVPKVMTNLLFPFVSEEEIESRNALIRARKKYLHSEFKFDIISLLPLELLCFCFRKPFSVFAYFRLNRFLRLVTVQCYLRFTKKMVADLIEPAITAMVIDFSLFIHTSTCFWHFLGVYHDHWKPKSSWRWRKNNTATSVSNTSSSSAVCFGNDYVCSMYFIILTTLRNGGVHDILPRQHIEIIFVCVLMLFSMMMYMIYVGEFSRIIHYQSYRCFKFYEKYVELQEFLKNNRVSHSLVNQTKKYTLYLWREARGLQSPQFLDTAPQCLRLKIMSAAYMKLLIGTPIFKHCEPAFLRHLVGHLKPFYYDGNMYVVREGEITNAMYFVHKGRVGEIEEDTERKTQVINTGAYFGMVQGLYRDIAYTHSYKTEIKSQVLTLSLDTWEYLLKLYPENINIIYYRNIQDPRTDDEFKPKKEAKVRAFPPRSMMTVEKELPKGTDPKTTTGESKPGSDNKSRSTEQLIKELKERVHLTLCQLNNEPFSGASTANTGIGPLNKKIRDEPQVENVEIEEKLISDYPFLKKESLSTSNQPRLQKTRLMLPPDEESQNKAVENSSPLGGTQSIIPESHSKSVEPLSTMNIPEKKKKVYKKELHPLPSNIKDTKIPATKENIPKGDVPQSASVKAIAAVAGGSAAASTGTILTNTQSLPLLPSKNTGTALTDKESKTMVDASLKKENTNFEEHIETRNNNNTVNEQEKNITDIKLLGRVPATANVIENISSAPSNYKRRKSTVIGIDKDAIRKELESIPSNQDELTQPVVIDLTATSSPSLLRDSKKMKPSLEEIELANISYRKEYKDENVKTSDNINFDDKLEKDTLQLQQDGAATSSKQIKSSDKDSLNTSSSKASRSQGKLKKPASNEDSNI